MTKKEKLSWIKRNGWVIESMSNTSIKNCRKIKVSKNGTTVVGTVDQIFKELFG